MTREEVPLSEEGERQSKEFKMNNSKVLSFLGKSIDP